MTAESINELKRIERLGKGILGLKIKKTEEKAVEIEAHAHHH